MLRYAQHDRCGYFPILSVFEVASSLPLFGIALSPDEAHRTFFLTHSTLFDFLCMHSRGTTAPPPIYSGRRRFPSHSNMRAPLAPGVNLCELPSRGRESKRHNSA